MALRTVKLSDVLILACLLWAAKGGRHVHFAQYSLLNGYTCQLHDIVFSIEDVSQIQCSSTCVGSPYCVIFFYSSYHSLCTGCSRRFENTADLIVSEFTIAFMVNKKSQGDACNSSYECDGDFICFSNRCLCSPGYYYHPVMGTCTTYCWIYGNTFQDYENVAIPGNDFLITAPISHDNCKQMCSHYSDCGSVDYQLSSKTCCMASVDALQNSLGSYSGYVYSQRNCG